MSGDEWFVLFVGFFVGFFTFGAVSYFFFPDSVVDYPGLEERLVEEQDRCEARPGVITCTWDETEAAYTPKETP